MLHSPATIHHEHLVKRKLFPAPRTILNLKTDIKFRLLYNPYQRRIYGVWAARRHGVAVTEFTGADVPVRKEEGTHPDTAQMMAGTEDKRRSRVKKRSRRYGKKF